MTSRGDIVSLAQRQVGTLVPSPYDGPNPYTQSLGRGYAEAWCGDFVTWCYWSSGLALPLLQGGMNGRQTGFSYVPSAVAYARLHSQVVMSWQAQPGDLVCFDWNGDGIADHVELAEGWSAGAGGVLTTIGGNSGPRGGVNRHTWAAPIGPGNDLVLAVINAADLVTFGAPNPLPFPGRVMALTSPLMVGSDVRSLQAQLAHVGYSHTPAISEATVGGTVAWTLGAAGYRAGELLASDGIYGAETCGTVAVFQASRGLTVDGIAGPQTWASLFG